MSVGFFNKLQIYNSGPTAFNVPLRDTASVSFHHPWKSSSPARTEPMNEGAGVSHVTCEPLRGLQLYKQYVLALKIMKSTLNPVLQPPFSVNSVAHEENHALLYKIYHCIFPIKLMCEILRTFRHRYIFVHHSTSLLNTFRMIKLHKILFQQLYYKIYKTPV